MQYISQDMKKNTQFKYETLPTQKRTSIQKLTLEIEENLRTNDLKIIIEICHSLSSLLNNK